METKKAETAIEKLESKIKDCKNDTTIFSTKKYVLFDDAKKILEQQTTSQQQTIERLRELCRMAYTAIRHETNSSNSMLDVYFEIEKEVILNTTEPIDQ